MSTIKNQYDQNISIAKNCIDLAESLEKHGNFDLVNKYKRRAAHYIDSGNQKARPYTDIELENIDLNNYDFKKLTRKNRDPIEF